MQLKIMILHETQGIVARDTHRFRVCCNGRRWGKTTLAIEEIKGKALSGNCRIAYVAPTYGQARDICWETLKKELEPIIINVNESRLELKVRNTKDGESIVILRGWESIDNLRGQKFDFIVIDEVAMVRNFWEKWEEVIRPTLTDNRGHCLFISTPKGFNHFYELFCMQNDPTKGTEFKSFHFTTADNPYMPPDEIEKAKQELTDTRFHQEYMADFRKTEGLVYQEFDLVKSVYSDDSLVINPNLRIDGVDFGFTNPTAIIEVTRDYDNNYWVHNEWYRTGKTNEEVIEYAKTLDVNYFYPDPEDPQRIEEWKRAGLPIREVNKDVDKGIDTIRSLLKNGKLKIHSRCKRLIDEFQTYTYKEKANNSNEPEQPVKENDHGLDALRYALYMQNPNMTAKREARQYVPKGLARNVLQTKWLDKNNSHGLG